MPAIYSPAIGNKVRDIVHDAVVETITPRPLEPDSHAIGAMIQAKELASIDFFTVPRSASAFCLTLSFRLTSIMALSEFQQVPVSLGATRCRLTSLEGRESVHRARCRD